MNLGIRFVVMGTSWALLAIACDDGGIPVEIRDNIAPKVLTDVNPDADIVEVELVATPSQHSYLEGKPADVWAFRDGAVASSAASIPGPMLQAKLGDLVIVHFTNELPEETTIHWHGLRVPNAADGTPFSQLPVSPGETFVYEFTLIDSGYYWFHPHLKGDVQVEAGLYAPIIVDDGVAIDVAADRAFVLDDVKIESDGKLSERTELLDIMLGRLGNVVLINGRQRPTIDVASGSRERWRFVNAANGRYFNLELPGHTFTVIGWDGGLIAAPYETATLLVAPGERYEVLVEVQASPGDALALRTLHYDRGHEVPDPGPIEILALEVQATTEAAEPLPAIFGQVAPIELDETTPRRRFILREDDSVPAQPVFSINNESFPNITPVVVPTGLTEVWRIENTEPDMDHPFHLHGMSFQVLDAEGRLATPLGWKDTVNVPKESIVDVVVQYGAPGRWMYHCHVLEHAERGMMGELEVTP